MSDYAVVNASADLNTRCEICGHMALWSKGLRIVAARTSRPVCPSCSSRSAPRLHALILLSRVAEQIGRRSRHTLTPPIESLLELARAAESFAGDPSALKAG